MRLCGRAVSFVKSLVDFFDTEGIIARPGLWLLVGYEGFKFLVIGTIFICAIVFPASLEREIEERISRQNFRRVFFEGERDNSKLLAKFSDVKFSGRKCISVSYPSQEYNGSIGQERLKFRSWFQRVCAKKKVLGTSLWSKIKRGLGANNCFSKVALFDQMDEFLASRKMVDNVERINHFDGWRIPAVLECGNEIPLPTRECGWVILNHDALCLNLLEMYESALHGYQRIMINPVGFKHGARLNSSEDGINCRDYDYRNSRSSNYRLVVLGITKPFEFHWQWLPFGIGGLILCVYGYFLFLFGLTNEGSSIILLKGLGFSIGGWLAGVFCLFHWLYQQ